MDSNDRAILEEFALRQDAKQSILAFYEFMHQRSDLLEFRFPLEPHQILMLEALQNSLLNIHRKVQIEAPPGSSKSTMLKIGCMWLWVVNPEAQIIRVSATEELSQAFARDQRAILADPYYQALTDFKIDPESKSVSDFKNTAGGRMVSAGMGSSLSGRRCHALIIDDPVRSLEDVGSALQRQKQFNWFSSEARTREFPNAAEIIVSTRWHSQDLVGMLQSNEGDEWKIISLPLFADSENDPLGRKRNEVLWPWFYENRLDEIQRDPYTFQSLYQQKPLVHEGQCFNADNIEIIEPLGLPMTTVIGVDLAVSTKQTADASALVVVGVTQNNDYVVQYVYNERTEIKQSWEAVKQLYSEYGARCVVMENALHESALKSLVRDDYKTFHDVVQIQTLPTHGRSKEVRSITAQNIVAHGRLKLVRGHWNAKFLEQLTSFPAGRHDDMVDGLSLACNYLSKITGPSAPIPEKPKPIVGGITIGQDGIAYTTQTFDELFDDNRPSRWGRGRL